MLTIPQIISVAKLSQVITDDKLAKSGLFNSPKIDPSLPFLIYRVRKSVEWMYGKDPNYPTLRQVANYLYSICPYSAQALAIINNGGSPITPTTPTIIKSPIPIFGSDFATATAWNGQNSDSISIRSTYTLQVFWNDIQRFLQEGTEWNRTSSGIEIINNGTTITGFDALTNPDYSLYIYISL